MRVVDCRLLCLVALVASPAFAAKVNLPGQVTYRERIALPDLATLEIQLVDQSLPSLPPRLDVEAPDRPRPGAAELQPRLRRRADPPQPHLRADRRDQRRRRPDVPQLRALRRQSAGARRARADRHQPRRPDRDRPPSSSEPQPPPRRPPSSTPPGPPPASATRRSCRAPTPSLTDRQRHARRRLGRLQLLVRPGRSSTATAAPRQHHRDAEGLHAIASTCRSRPSSPPSPPPPPGRSPATRSRSMAPTAKPCWCSAR